MSFFCEIFFHKFTIADLIVNKIFYIADGQYEKK